MIVEKIIYSDKTSEYSLIVGLYVLTLREESLTEFNIYKGKELSEEDLDEIKAYDNFIRALNKAYKILAYPRTANQVKMKLKEDMVDEFTIEDVIYYLNKNSYLNDLEYGKSYAKDRVNLSKDGPLKIYYKLLEKGLSKEDARKSIYSIDTEIYEQNVIDVAKKKLNLIKSGDVKKKLWSYLQQKGYDSSLIKLALEEVIS